MSRLKTSIAVATACLALAAPVVVTTGQVFVPRANAAVTDQASAAAQEAADWLVAQLEDGDHFADDAGGATADGVLALVGIDGYDTHVEAMADWLASQAAAYATTGPAAAKLAIAAAATDRDARSFGGVDLVEVIEDSMTPDGQYGDFGYAFGQALAIIALVRTGDPVPPEAVDFLMTFQDPATGGYGFASGDTFTTDADSTALALTALAAVVDMPGARESAVAARDYLAANLTADGYWPGYSPVNSTALAGSAMQLVGEPIEESIAWMETQQLADGGLPSTLDGTTSDLMATLQGALLLAGQSLLSTGQGGIDRVELGEPAPTPTQTAEPTGTPTPSPSPSTPAPTASEPETEAASETGAATETESVTATLPATPEASSPDQPTATTDPVSAEDLPATGTNSLPLALAALAATILGLVLLTTDRFRNRGQEDR